MKKRKSLYQRELDISFTAKEKRIIVWMIIAIILAFVIIIVIPVSLYKHRSRTQNPTETSLVKEISDDDNQTTEEKNLEEDVKDIENNGQEVDPFYPLILKQIEEQKKNPFIVVPANYIPRDNYLTNAATEQGTIHIFKKNPIMVYVPKGEYFNAITQAFASYNYTFKGLLGFQAVHAPENADIVVEVKDSLSNVSDMDTAIGMAGPDRYDKDGNIDSAKIIILDHDLYTNKKATLIEVYNVTLHEIGHTIGIAGHSSDSNDVLYQSGQRVPKGQLEVLSERDKETIKIMYSGNEELIKQLLDNVYDTKLLENVRYAHEHNNADAYLAVADSYYYAKQYEKARKAYITALKLNPQNPRIYIKLAFCYLSAEKYDTAITYAQKGLEKSRTNDEKAIATYYIAAAYEAKGDYETALKYGYDLIGYIPNDKAPFLAYLQTCKNYNKKMLANKAYNKYIRNYENDFSEQEQILLKWASSPF